VTDRTSPQPNDRFTSPMFVGMRFVAQRLMLKPLVWSLTRVQVHGKKDLRGLPNSFIVVANHSSHLDAPLIIGGLPYRNARYLAAGAAADYFFDVKWRKWLTALFFNAFPVDRAGKRKSGGVSKSLLERGVPLLIFPEGGRSATGILGRFKPGAAALAISCDVPCLPVALVGANVAMPRGQSWPSAGRDRVAIVFGAPMRPLDGETAEDFSSRLAAEVVRLHGTVTIPGVPAIEEPKGSE
jgi:1-acyl-sn-glycerol-3-phosphate acyltransferase